MKTHPQTSHPKTAPPPGAMTDPATPSPGNDNAWSGGIPDTCNLVAHPEVVQYLRAALRRYGVAPPDMADAIAEVQAASIEAARTGRMPASLAPWKALAVTIAVHWAVDRLRAARVRGKYDAGLCEDADAYASPTLHWEQRDPVDTKRYLAVLEELFDSGQMPEHADEILSGEADGVSREEIAAEIGISETAVGNRLFRMRARFRARLVALGMLPVLLLLLAALLTPKAEVAAPALRTNPVESAPRPRFVPAPDAGAAVPPENSSAPVRRNGPDPD